MANEERLVRVDDGVIVPSPEETADAIKGIDDRTSNNHAAEALRALAFAVINAVTELDRRMPVASYFSEIRVISKGDGVFALDIYEKNVDIDPQHMANEIAEELDRQGGLLFGKQLRPIQLNDPEDRSHDPGNPGNPADS